MTVKAQFGSVSLSDYNVMPDGRSVRVIMGLVSIDEAIAAIGLKVSRSESNWFATIAGERAVVYIPGCRVAGIALHPEDVFTGGEVYRVP